MIKTNAAVRLKATQQSPTVPGRTSSHQDTSGGAVFADDSGVIAPSMSYKKENEDELKNQQKTRETDLNKNSEMDKTAVKDNPSTASTVSSSALRRLRASTK